MAGVEARVCRSAGAGFNESPGGRDSHYPPFRDEDIRAQGSEVSSWKSASKGLSISVPL